MGSTGPKVTLHLVRHAQGYHNLTPANHWMVDPELTPLGISQCSTLNKTFPYHSRITHLIASPLKRTLATCLLSFHDEVTEKGLKVLCIPELQETADVPCDTGSDRDVLAAELATKKGVWADFGAEAVDLSLVVDGWNSKRGKWGDSSTAIEARAKVARVAIRDVARKRLAQDPAADVDIAVVTHGGYLHFFTEDWDGYEAAHGTGWVNTEWRSYEYADDADANASLKETLGSRERRRGKEVPLTDDEVRELKAVTK